MKKSKTTTHKNNSIFDFKQEDFKISKAKLFLNGRSQAVRLPKEYRFDGSEIGVGRVGNAVLLYPLNDPWAVFFEGAKELRDADLGILEREQNQSKRKFEK